MPGMISGPHSGRNALIAFALIICFFAALVVLFPYFAPDQKKPVQTDPHHGPPT